MDRYLMLSGAMSVLLVARPEMGPLEYLEYLTEAEDENEPYQSEGVMFLEVGLSMARRVSTDFAEALTSVRYVGGPHYRDIEFRKGGQRTKILRGRKRKK